MSDGMARRHGDEALPIDGWQPLGKVMLDLLCGIAFERQPGDGLRVSGDPPVNSGMVWKGVSDTRANR